jgi:hypothetical protein
MKNREFNFRSLTAREGRKENDRYAQFVTEDKDIVDTFVRELNQNSADARGLNQDKAKLIIRILTESEIKEPYLKKVTKSLEVPLDIKLKDLTTRVLTIEELHTTGLRGSIDIRDEDSDHNGFWLDSGRATGKGKQSNSTKSGSAGKGNIILFAASEIRTVLACTDRIDATSHEEYILGKCELLHSFEDSNDSGERKSYEGFYCDFGHEDAVIPIDDTQELKEFKEAFDLKRSSLGKGTSFVIPYPKKEFTEESILESILKENFYLILDGQLEVEVNGRTVDRSNVCDVADEILQEGKENRDFILETITFNSLDVVEVDENWKEEVNSSIFDATEFLKIQDTFNKDQLICLDVPLEVEKKDGSSEIGFFKLFLKKDPFKEKRQVIRNGIPLTSEPYRSSKVRSPYRSLLLIGTDELGSYCKSAETPNHIRFDAGMDSLTTQYKNPQLIRIIRNSSSEFARFFLGLEDGLDTERLSKILSVKIKGPEKKKEPKKRKIIIKPKPPGGGPYRPPSYSHNYFNHKTLNGWMMEQGNDPLPTIPCKVICKFGLAELGSPDNKKPNLYDPNDFDFGNSSQWLINTTNINIVNQNKERLELEITDQDFFIEVQHDIFEEYDVRVSAEI